MTERLITGKEIEEGRGRFRHLLMQSVWTARDYHASNFTPERGWESLKKPFEEHASGIARPETFTEQFGIQAKISTFVQHGLSASWAVQEEVIALNSEGNGIDDFMQSKKFELSRE